MRQIEVSLDWERKLVLYFTLLAAAVFLGPFGTYDKLPLWERLVFWTLDITTAAVLMHVALVAVYQCRFLNPLPHIVRFILAVALGAVPTTAAIIFFFHTIVGNVEMTAGYPLLWIEVFIFSLVLMWFEFVIWPKYISPQGASVAAETPEAQPILAEATLPPRLYQHLPDNLQTAEIISISMQDHYAEISTTLGTHMELIRLKDAIELLDGVAGAQVHRSHWVSKSAAREVVRVGRRHEIKLSDGRAIPVSETYLDIAREMASST